MILIGTDEGVYRWFEGGPWPVFHSLQDRAVTGLASPGRGVLVAVDRGGDVLETLDHGITWRALPLPAGAGRPTAVAVHGASPEVVMAVKPLGVYKRAVGAPTPRPPVPAEAGWLGRARTLAEGATALVAPSRVRPYSDAETVRLGGWVPVNAPPVPRTTTPAEVSELACVRPASGPAAWLAATPGSGLWRSTDLGRSWAQCAGMPSDVFALRPMAARPGEVWAATSDGCRFSADAGQTWEDRSAGLDGARQVRAVAVKPGDPKVMLAGAAPAAPGAASPADGLGFALFESANGGQSWTRVVKRNFPEDLDYDTIRDIQFDPTAPDNIIVALGSGELWVTRNAGAYWGPLARQIRAARALCAVS